MATTFDENELLDFLAKELFLERGRLTPESRFIEDLGVDSLGAAELLMKVEDKYDFTIPNEPERFKTVGAVLEFAKQELAARTACAAAPA